MSEPKDKEVTEEVKLLVKMCEEIAIAVAPIFQRSPENGNIIQKSMTLILMRAIQATTERADWVECARENSEFLIKCMKNGFVDHPEINQKS